jgi:hypothetical protein
LLIKWLHCVHLLIGLFGDLAGDCISRVHVVIATFVELLVVLKKHVNDDHFDNASTIDELEHVRG